MHDADPAGDDANTQTKRERERSRVHSEASLTLETLGDTRTTNTRHRQVVLRSLYTKLLYSCVVLINVNIKVKIQNYSYYCNP